MIVLALPASCRARFAPTVCDGRIVQQALLWPAHEVRGRAPGGTMRGTYLWLCLLPSLATQNNEHYDPL